MEEKYARLSNLAARTSPHLMVRLREELVMCNAIKCFSRKHICMSVQLVENWTTAPEEYVVMSQDSSDAKQLCSSKSSTLGLCLCSYLWQLQSMYRGHGNSKWGERELTSWKGVSLDLKAERKARKDGRGKHVICAEGCREDWDIGGCCVWIWKKSKISIGIGISNQQRWCPSSYCICSLHWDQFCKTHFIHLGLKFECSN